ncbi:MAG: extracellular solute-binding protein [Variibacter sp.]|nr:extracellular solute-binding protein [Variibacter sp.]
MRGWSGLAAAAGVCLCLATTAAAQERTPPVLADINDAAERARVEALIEDARKERHFSWIGVMILPEQGRKILAEFKRYYGLDELSAEYTYAHTGELVTRVEQLLRAKRNSFDVVWTIAWPWYKDLLMRGELMHYSSPHYAAYTLSHQARLSMDGYWVSDAYTFSPLYNPAALEARGVKGFAPTSWKDFTDPRLKGLVSISDMVKSTSSAPTGVGIAKVLGEKWFHDLARNVQPVLYAQTAQARDWVGSGEFPVTLFNYAKDATILLKRNIKVRLIYPQEGVVLLPFAPAILKSAPHPATARLFIDFVRSARGAQTVMDAGSLLFFGRPGVKSPDPELLPPWENLNLIPFDWETDGSPASIKRIREVFREAGLGR